jgi:regulator of sigma E protease
MHGKRSTALVDVLLSGTGSLLAFIGMLCVLVIVHELGHFLTAIWMGIKVEEFGLGYPPHARTLFERKGVRYTLNWIPIGGFVRFAGEGESIYGSGGTMASANPWRKILVLAAGPLMNLFLAVLIFAGMFMAYGMPEVANGAKIMAIYPGTPAEQGGLQNGDVIIEVAGQPILSDLEVLRTAASSNPGTAVAVVIEREGQRLERSVTPAPWVYEGEERPAGFGLSYGANILYTPVGPFEAFGAGFTHSFKVLGDFLDGLRKMVLSAFGAAEPLPGGVTGVVGMARGTGEVIENGGLRGFLEWTALISLNLFLINLLPIPALDGSHIIFSLIEIVRRGRKIAPEREAMVHAFGFMMLMGLMVIVTISDVANWIRGVPVFGGG